MDTSSIPLKQCSRKEKCIHSLGSWLPASNEFFSKDRRRQDGLNRTCKACTGASGKAWRDSHPTYFKDLYATDPETKKHSSKEYRRTHVEEVRQKDRERYKQRASHQRSQARKRRQSQDGSKKIQAYRQQPDVKQRHRVESSRRRAQVLENKGTFTQEDVEIQIRIQKARCWWCGKKLKGKYHVDHRIPLSRGGSNAPENLCISCPKCNLSKGAKLPQEWNGRLL